MFATCHSGHITGQSINPTPKDMRAFLEESLKHSRRIVCWNSPFDVGWLIASGLRDLVFANKWLDGMLIWKHLTNSPHIVGVSPTSYGLKEAVRTFRPECAGYEEGINFDPQTSEEHTKLAAYNVDDAVNTYTIATQLWDKLSTAQQRAALIEAEAIPMVAESRVEGLVFDRVGIEALSTKLEDAATVAHVNIKLAGGGSAVSAEVLNSPTQLAKLMFDTWKLPCRYFTDKGKPSTDKVALARLAPSDVRAKYVHEYREAVGNRTKFCTNVIKSLDYNGDERSRPQANLFGTYTGRMTYSSKQGRGVNALPIGVALHQWKRSPEFRATIAVPEGYTALEFDFAGQEFRWMAVESMDPVMLGLCAPGEDAHAYMGAKIAKLDYRELQRLATVKGSPEAEKRQLGKVGNLSLQYRTSAATLVEVAFAQYGVSLTLKQSEAIHATYQTTYVQVPDYWKRQINIAKTQGFVETKAGRRVQLTQGPWPFEHKWSRESTAINFPIQGVGADQKYLGLLVAKNYLPKVDGHFYFEMHDGLIFIVPDRYALKAYHEIKIMLSNLPYKRAWGFTSPIQFPVDAKLGKAWGTMKELKDAA